MRRFATKFMNSYGWSKEINCNALVKQGCPLFPTLLSIYIDKLESCLEEANCAHTIGTILTNVVIIFCLYVDHIVLCPGVSMIWENNTNSQGFFL